MFIFTSCKEKAKAKTKKVRKSVRKLRIAICLEYNGLTFKRYISGYLK
jgi:hypothetical protein